MTQTTIICRSCGTSFEVERRRARRWLAAGFGAVVGGVVTESFIGAVLGGAATYAAYAAYDEHHGRHCPSCGVVAWRLRRVDHEPAREEQAAAAS